MSNDKYSEITCRVCNKTGSVQRAKVRRMSGPVVAIGYIVLVPSVLGMLFGTLLFCSSGKAAGNVSDTNRQEYSTQIAQLGLAPEQVDHVLSLTKPDREALQEYGLTQDQARDVMRLHLSKSAGDAGAGIGAAMGIGAAIFVTITSFVGGLLGWLLIMKKPVLLCGNCKGVHADAA